MGTYSKYNYWYDTKTNEIIKRAGRLVHERKREPERYVEIGSYYAHQQQPYVDGTDVCRTIHGNRVVVVDLKKHGVKVTKEGS